MKNSANPATSTCQSAAGSSRTSLKITSPPAQRKIMKSAACPTAVGFGGLRGTHYTHRPGRAVVRFLRGIRSVEPDDPSSWRLIDPGARPRRGPVIGSFIRTSTSSVSLRLRNRLSFFCDRGCASRSACANDRGRGGGVGEPALMARILPN